MSESIHLNSGSRTDLLHRLERKMARTFVRNHGVLQSERPIVSFTFDDIPKSAATAGADILEKAQQVGTFYIAGGLLDKQFGPWEFAGMLDVAALHAAGHEIGCHTYSHNDNQRVKPRELDADIKRNAMAVRSAIPTVRLENFAYPYGSVGMMQKWGNLNAFASCRGTHPGINGRRMDVGQLQSVLLNDETTPPDELRKLIDDTVAVKGWLIFHTHEVKSNPTSQGCTPELLEEAVKLAMAAGCEVRSVRDAMQSVKVSRRRAADITAMSPDGAISC